MPREPKIPHEELVRFVLNGYSARDAQKHFGFPNKNVSNLRIHAAFKRMGIKRPKFQEQRKCKFCSVDFVAGNVKQYTCGSKKCQEAIILQWQKLNRDKVRDASKKYKHSPRGHIKNIEMHKRRYLKGSFGSVVDKWNYAADHAGKRLRKLKELSLRNQWSYRIQHIQQMVSLSRSFNKRAERDLTRIASYNNQYSTHDIWGAAVRAIQTTIYQCDLSHRASVWEKTINRIQNAVRVGGLSRQWKKTAKSQ